MSLELKIKTKHLGLEAKVIRYEENKLARQLNWAREKVDFLLFWKLHAQKMSISLHRRNELREEQRAAFIARAYLAGTPYKATEKKRKPEREYRFKNYIIPRAAKLINKYGGSVKDDQLYAWSNLE